MTSFRDKISREALEESDKLLAIYDQLKVDAEEIVKTLNSLNLDVPLRLRELERVPRIRRLIEENQEALDLLADGPKPKRATGTPAIKAWTKKRQKLVEKEHNKIETDVHNVLVIKPTAAKDIKLPYSQYQIKEALKRLREKGKADFRTEKWQGPSIWYLTERPVTLEQVRDAALKVRDGVGRVLPEDVATELKIERHVALHEMQRLVGKDILKFNTFTGAFTYEKPTGPPVNRPKVKEQLPRTIKTNGKSVAGTGRAAKLSSDKEVQQIIKVAEALGAQVKKLKNDHISVSYKGETRILASTPGDSNRSNREKLKDLGINV